MKELEKDNSLEYELNR